MALGATHYNWRWDVRALVDRVLYWYPDASANTYYDHPTGWGLDDRSVDFWHWWGRGYDIDYYVGEGIVNYVWYDPNPPWIRWYIWQGVIWVCPVPADASQCYWDWYWDPWDLHYDHVHFTFW
jgi:hypothetical protein